MPRAKSFDPDAALDRAVEQFWRAGYDGTSMVQLLESMGISRQSLYDTFGDKHRLFLAAMDRYRAMVGQGLRAKLEQPESPLEGLREGFTWVRAQVLDDPEHRSCLMANAALELGQRDDEVRSRVAAHLADTEELFFATLERARARGELGADNTRALARFLTTTIHGLGIMARGGASEAALDDTIELALGTLRRGS